MANPDITQTVNERGLGILNTASTTLHVKVGLSSLGTTNTLDFVNDATTLTSTYGTGELVDAVAHKLASSGGPVGVVRVAQDVAGAAGAVTKAGTGTGTVTVAGAAQDAYSVIVEVTTAGLLTSGAGVFRYTLDGGKTYSNRLAIPIAAPAGTSTYPIPNTGLTLTFADGGGSPTGYAVGDTFSFTTTAPTTTAGNIATAIAAVLSSQVQVAFIHLVGAVAPGADDAATATSAVALAASLEAQLHAAFLAHRHLFVLMECPVISKAAAKAAFNTFVGSRVMVAFGQAVYQGALQDRRRQQTRSAAWGLAERLSSIPPGQDAAAYEDGPLTNILSLVHDEGGAGDMDEARFSTLRTYVGDNSGYYVHGARMMSAPGSDIVYAQHRRVMDIACTVNYQAMKPYLNAKLQVNTTTGRILEEQARVIESNATEALRAALVDTESERGEVSGVRVEVNRKDNILSTSNLRTEVFVVPHGYAKAISSKLSFFNPALQAQTQP